MKQPFAVLAAVAAAAATGACAHDRVIAGTRVADTEENRAIVSTIETYRQRLIERNVDGLLVLASPHYFEDSGTPRADDDYGYDGLKEVLTKRLTRLKAIRFDVEFRRVKVQSDGKHAEVEVRLNGSFELGSEAGDRYRRVDDYWHFMLEKAPGSGADRWLFLSGM